jgi:hypothetical protein
MCQPGYQKLAGETFFSLGIRKEAAEEITLEHTCHPWSRVQPNKELRRTLGHRDRRRHPGRRGRPQDALIELGRQRRRAACRLTHPTERRSGDPAQPLLLLIENNDVRPEPCHQVGDRGFKFRAIEDLLIIEQDQVANPQATQGRLARSSPISGAGAEERDFGARACITGEGLAADIPCVLRICRDTQQSKGHTGSSTEGPDSFCRLVIARRWT